MTKEGFYNFAENRQKIDAESIYQLTVRYYWEETKGYRKKPKSDEWFYKIYKVSSLYSTKETAEKALRKYLEPEEIIHSALIERIAVNLPLGNSNVMEWWLYDKNGNEIDKSVCTSLLKEPMDSSDVFWGRNASQIRFKEGDIVEVIRNGRVYLEVICGLPASVDEMWGRYRDHMEKESNASNYSFNSEYFENCFSDCYYYLQHNGYTADVPPFSVMKPVFPIPEAAKKILTSRYKLKFLLAKGKL